MSKCDAQTALELLVAESELDPVVVVLPEDGLESEILDAVKNLGLSVEIDPPHLHLIIHRTLDATSP